MTAPTVQRFFATPLISVAVEDTDAASLCEAALALAKHYTVDVSQPALQRFDWSVEVKMVVVAPGEHQPLLPSYGDFWIGACCVDAGDGSGHLQIEDPRLTMIGAGPEGLLACADSLVVELDPVPGELHLFSAYLRHGIANPGQLSQRWAFILLRARPL